MLIDSSHISSEIWCSRTIHTSQDSLGGYVTTSAEKPFVQAIWIWGGALIVNPKQALLSCYVRGEIWCQSIISPSILGSVLCSEGEMQSVVALPPPYKSWSYTHEAWNEDWLLVSSFKFHVGPRPNPPIIEKPCLTMAPIICHRNTSSGCKLCISYCYRMNNNKRTSTLGCKDANNST